MSTHLGPVPHLHTDTYGVAATAWQQVPVGGYRLVTLGDGALSGKDVLLQKEAAGHARLFLLPGPEPLAKRLRLDGIGDTLLEKSFQDLDSTAQSVKATVPRPPTVPTTWSSANKPTHIAPITRPDGQTTYIALHQQPGPEIRATRIGNPAQTGDGSVMIRNARTVPMTANERAINQNYGVRQPSDLPSLALGDNASEARSRAVIHPDFRLRDETGFSKPERAMRLVAKGKRGGLVDSDLPAHYSSGPALMGIGPDGHVMHVATGQTDAMQAEMSAGHPYRKTSYSYLDHSHKESGGGGPTGHPDRGFADDFLHHAIYNPAWVTIRRYADGKEVMYRHVYPRSAGKHSGLARDLPSGLTYLAERVHHPSDPQGSHWNIFDVLPNQGDRDRSRTQEEYAARAHFLADDNRGQQYWRVGEDPQDPRQARKKERTSVKYIYLNNNGPPKPAR